jgi:hypothetical protein
VTHEPKKDEIDTKKFQELKILKKKSVHIRKSNKEIELQSNAVQTIALFRLANFNLRFTFYSLLNL